MITIAKLPLGNDFLERPELVLAPARVVEIFVKLNDGPGAQPIGEISENIAS